MTDFPDWQPAAATQSPNQYAGFIQTLTPGPHLSPIVPVFSWSSYSLIVIASAGAAKAGVNHYADLAGTQLIGTDQWSVNPATGLAVRGGLRGQFAQPFISVTSAGSLTAQTWCTYLTQPTDKITFPVGNQQISDSRSVAANGVVNLTMGLTCCGPATWTYNPLDASGKLSVLVNGIDELGNLLSVISNRGKPAALDNALLNIPDQIIQVQVTNTDTTTAHGYGVSLTVPPY